MTPKGSPRNLIDRPDSSRRTFIKQGLLCLTCLALPLPSLARTMETGKSERSISLFNTHTGESLSSVVYWADGQYRPEGLERINFLLRDHRNGKIETIDTLLLDQLHRLNRRLGNRDPYHIISGYRSPATNRKLQQAGRAVATTSFHLTGQAVDIRLPKVKIAQLRRAALDLGAGGVGYYPRSNFVHLDTGPRRSW